MERFLMVQVVLISMILVFGVQLVIRSDEKYPRRWAKIRVEIDDKPRHVKEPGEEDEIDPQGLYKWLVIAVILFFFLLFLAN
jgi:hypothetical protein